jgi:hypothetical protein
LIYVLLGATVPPKSALIVNPVPGSTSTQVEPAFTVTGVSNTIELAVIEVFDTSQLFCPVAIYSTPALESTRRLPPAMSAASKVYGEKPDAPGVRLDVLMPPPESLITNVDPVAPSAPTVASAIFTPSPLMYPSRSDVVEIVILFGPSIPGIPCGPALPVSPGTPVAPGSPLRPATPSLPGTPVAPGLP